MNSTIITIIEIAGTIAFSISGIRLAAQKSFDLFGAYVVGLVAAIGGGTIRDILLDLTPIWMEEPIYLIVTALSLVMYILLGRRIMLFEHTFLIFDTIGLALFTVLALDKSLDAGFPIWVAMIMGMITGCFGGVLRDLMVGEVPLLFRRDIYALASLLGGGVLSIFLLCGINESLCSLIGIATIITIRTIAVKYHLHLPILPNRETKREDS